MQVARPWPHRNTGASAVTQKSVFFSTATFIPHPPTDDFIACFLSLYLSFSFTAEMESCTGVGLTTRLSSDTAAAAPQILRTSSRQCSSALLRLAWAPPPSPPALPHRPTLRSLPGRNGEARGSCIYVTTRRARQNLDRMLRIRVPTTTTTTPLRAISLIAGISRSDPNR